MHSVFRRELNLKFYVIAYFNCVENIVIFEHGSELRETLKTGQKRYASMEIYNPCFSSQDNQCMDCNDWNTELMQLNRFELDVKEASVIEHFYIFVSIPF